MTPVPGASADAPEVEGLAHVAAVSFLASRLAPTGQFWVALAGGVALGRVGARHGLRAGYGASLASMLETVALIGPARVNGPLTQALNAPLVGRLHARGAPLAAQILACLSIRLLHYIALHVLFVWLVVGGLDAFADSYDKVTGWLGVLPRGAVAAVGFTVLTGLIWGAFYSVMQVLVYRRALRRWAEPEDAPPADPSLPPPARPAVSRGALLVVAAAVAGFAALLVSTSWPVLGAVALAVVAAWVGLRVHDRDALRVGLVLAAVLAVGALGPAVLGVVDLETGAQRAVRAGLLVAVATWARAAVGTEGVRAIASAALWRVRRVPSAEEASRLTVAIAADKRLASAGNSLLEALREVPHRPLPVADAVAGWVAAEAGRATASAPPGTRTQTTGLKGRDSNQLS